MNNVLTEIYGIDETIQAIQIDLYEQLSLVWSGDIEGYGRVYKNLENSTDDIPKYYKSAKIFIPEWYNASKGDYEDVFYDDNKACQFCFLVGDSDTTQDSKVFNTKAKVVFMVDLTKIYPSISERNDARAHRDVMEILRNYNYERYEIMGIDKGIDFVFTGYTTLNIRFDDLHPLHCFGVNIDLQYFLTDKCI